jgi:GcrA cell cycle regulator
MPVSWTDERIDRLRALWSNGVPASQIAEDLGGVSRNAVIGKAHRLGLQARPSPVKANEESNDAAAPAKAAAKKPKEAAARPAAKAEAEPVVEIKAEAPPAPIDIFEEELAEEEEAESEAPAEGAPADAKPAPPAPIIRSIGPGGFVRQGPGDQQAPIPPAPPRRLVPAKPSPEIADKTGLLDLNEKICKWPIGHPGEPDFHFCGKSANPGFPYCVEHCGVAYQAQLPRRDRKPPPPLPFGGPRVR